MPLDDGISTAVTQVTVSGGIVGGVDQPQWHSLHTKRPAAQLQSKKRGQSLYCLSVYVKVNNDLCDVYKISYSTTAQVKNLDIEEQSLPHLTS